jgi:cell division protease FtsH
MVTEFGMSEAMGAVNYDGHRGNKFLDTPFMNERGNHSEDTARKIDIEVKQILTDAHNEARRVLRERTAILDQLSTLLLEKEVIEGDELRALLGAVPPRDPDGTLPAVVIDAGG